MRLSVITSAGAEFRVGVPWNHFGRKNLGFLFAIHYGAKVIYDTDDDNEILATHALSLPHTDQSTTGTFLD